MDDERSDISIDGNIATWNINITGDIQGTYVGIFKFKCYLTPIEQIKANRDYREMIGPNPLGAPEHETFLAYALCQLKYRVISAPPFWISEQGGIGGNIPDEDVLSAVLSAATDSEVKYRDMLKKRKEEALERARKAAEKHIKEQRGETEEGSDEGKN